jgi:cysteine desulfurase
MGVAAEVSATDLGTVSRRMEGLRDDFEVGLGELVADLHINGVEAERLCNTSNVSFPGHEAQAVLMLLGEAGICASSGAACSSGSVTPSHVLQAMNLHEELVRSAIRFSFSRWNTKSEVEKAVSLIPKLLSSAAAVGRR